VNDIKLLELVTTHGELRLDAEKAARQAQGPTLRVRGGEQFLQSFDGYVDRIATLYGTHGRARDDKIVQPENHDPIVLTLDWIDAAITDMVRAQTRSQSELAELRTRSERTKPKQPVDDEVISGYVAQLRGDVKATLPETAEERRRRLQQEIVSSLEENWADFRRLAPVAAASSRGRPPVVVDMSRVDYHSASHPRDVDREVARLATFGLEAALRGDMEGQTILQKRAAAFQFVISQGLPDPSESESLAECAARLVREASTRLGVSGDLLVVEWTTAARVRGEHEPEPEAQLYTVAD